MNIIADYEDEFCLIIIEQVKINIYTFEGVLHLGEVVWLKMDQLKFLF